MVRNGGLSVSTKAALMLSVATVALSAAASAQQAPDVSLPEVVVTAPSPVVKPRAAKKRLPATQQGQTQASQAAQDYPEPQPPAQSAGIENVSVNPTSLPGTVITSDDAFVAVTIATEREILAQQGATITDTLQHKPGISGTTFAPGANRPIVRGLDSYRVRTQENGIGTHDVAALSEDHAIPIDPYSADRVEVVRGPATLRYGSQAIGGVVAVENQRVPTYIPTNGATGAVYGGVSSVDDGRDGGFNVTAGSQGFAVHADGFKRKSDDYDTPRGKQENTFVDSEGGSVGASLIGTDGFIGIAYARVDSLYGIPGEEVAIDLAQDKFLAKGEWRVRSGGIEALRFWFGASNYAHDEIGSHGHGDGDEHDHEGDDHAHDDEHGESEVGSRFTNREQEARFELQHQAFATSLGELNGALGVQWGNRKMRGQSFEGESLLEPAHTKSIAGFWFEELGLTDRLSLQAAARIERTTVDGVGWEDFHGHDGIYHAHTFEGERSFTPVSGSLGLLYQLPFNTVARLTGQYVERAPDAAELFSKGMHEATGTFEVGNPFLDEEKAATVEVGLKKATGAFRFDASAYYTRYNGFIYRQLQGLACEGAAHGDHFHCSGGGGDHDDHDHDDHADEGGHDHGAFDLVYFQQRDARFYGAEVAMQYDVAPIWNGVWGIDGQYDFVNAKFIGGGYVPRIPPHRLGGGLFYRDSAWFARVGVLHAFDQDRFSIEDEEIATPGYTLVSAELSYTTTLDAAAGSLAPQLTIGVKGENLADDDVLNHASFQRRENVLLPGANVRLFGKVSF